VQALNLEKRISECITKPPFFNSKTTDSGNGGFVLYKNFIQE